jgi:hypothetical protein
MLLVPAASPFGVRMAKVPLPLMPGPRSEFAVNTIVTAVLSMSPGRKKVAGSEEGSFLYRDGRESAR